MPALTAAATTAATASSLAAAALAAAVAAPTLHAPLAAVRAPPVTDVAAAAADPAWLTDGLCPKVPRVLCTGCGLLHGQWLL